MISDFVCELISRCNTITLHRIRPKLFKVQHFHITVNDGLIDELLSFHKSFFNLTVNLPLEVARSSEFRCLFEVCWVLRRFPVA